MFFTECHRSSGFGFQKCFFPGIFNFTVGILPVTVILNPTLTPPTQKLRWKDSSLDLRIPEDATEDWIKEEIFLQETILNKLHNYMQGKKV